MSLRSTVLRFLLALGAASSLPASGVTIYSANFNNSTNNAALTTGGGTWRVYNGADAASTYFNGGGGNGPSLSSGSGSTGTSGFIFVSLGGFSNVDLKPFLIHDTNPSFTTSELGTTAVGDLRTFSFAFSRGSATADISARVALRVGTDWYLSVDAITNAAANTWTPHSLDIQTIAWTPMTVNPGVEMSYPGTTTGTLTALGATGNLTQFGFLTSTQGGSNTQWRIDTVEITAIPEPATLSLLGGLLVLAVAAMRRRRA